MPQAHELAPAGQGLHVDRRQGPERLCERNEVVLHAVRAHQVSALREAEDVAEAHRHGVVLHRIRPRGVQRRHAPLDLLEPCGLEAQGGVLVAVRVARVRLPVPVVQVDERIGRPLQEVPVVRLRVVRALAFEVRLGRVVPSRTGVAVVRGEAGLAHDHVRGLAGEDVAVKPAFAGDAAHVVRRGEPVHDRVEVRDVVDPQLEVRAGRRELPRDLHPEAAHLAAAPLHPRLVGVGEKPVGIRLAALRVAAVHGDLDPRVAREAVDHVVVVPARDQAEPAEGGVFHVQADAAERGMLHAFRHEQVNHALQVALRVRMADVEEGWLADDAAVRKPRGGHVEHRGVHVAGGDHVVCERAGGNRMVLLVDQRHHAKALLVETLVEGAQEVRGVPVHVV